MSTYQKTSHGPVFKFNTHTKIHMLEYNHAIASNFTLQTMTAY